MYYGIKGTTHSCIEVSIYRVTANNLSPVVDTVALLRAVVKLVARMTPAGYIQLHCTHHGLEFIEHGANKFNKE